jgi:hypothetical protein
MRFGSFEPYSNCSPTRTANSNLWLVRPRPAPTLATRNEIGGLDGGASSGAPAGDALQRPRLRLLRDRRAPLRSLGVPELHTLSTVESCPTIGVHLTTQWNAQWGWQRRASSSTWRWHDAAGLVILMRDPAPFRVPQGPAHVSGATVSSARRRFLQSTADDWLLCALPLDVHHSWFPIRRPYKEHRR